MSDIKGTTWSVTINNPEAPDEEAIALARQKGWMIEGQLEKGESGTPHYQLLVKTKGQQRFSALKKQFPRAHIELARDPKALQKYVNKDDTRIGELQSQSEFYPSLSKLWDMFADFVDNKQFQNLTNADPDQKLVIFDKFIRHSIDEGYVVETMGVNPQIRSAVKNYGENIIFRSHRQKTDRQTRQRVEVDNLFSDLDTNTDEGQVQEAEGDEGSEAIETGSSGSSEDHT